MYHLLPGLIRRKEYLEKLSDQITAKLITSPAGTLRIDNSTGTPRYFHREKPSDKNGIYLKKTDLATVHDLAQKDYYQKMNKSIMAELKALQSLLNQYPVTPAEDIYDRLSPVRQRLVSPVIETDRIFIDNWVKVEYTGKHLSDDIPELLTDHGERERSKSELIIANILAKNNIPYRYEYPLYLEGAGIVHPDFTVLNVRLRKELYWEHQGMMDNPDYAEKAIQKIFSYNMNGIYPGDKLILTSETKNVPINIRQINGIIQHFLL